MVSIIRTESSLLVDLPTRFTLQSVTEMGGAAGPTSVRAVLVFVGQSARGGVVATVTKTILETTVENVRSTCVVCSY